MFIRREIIDFCKLFVYGNKAQAPIANGDANGQIS
jgi:hypothetical protein